MMPRDNETGIESAVQGAFARSYRNRTFVPVANLFCTLTPYQNDNQHVLKGYYEKIREYFHNLRNKLY